jgi:hypothetical protein
MGRIDVYFFLLLRLNETLDYTSIIQDNAITLHTCCSQLRSRQIEEDFPAAD